MFVKMYSHFERFAHGVKRWRTGDMKKRWLASAIVKVEELVRGSFVIFALVKNIESLAREKGIINDKSTI